MKYNFLRHDRHDDAVTYQMINELENICSIPLYIYRGDDACRNAVEIQGYLGEDVRLCYAVKANCYLAESLADVIEDFEVSSRGELEYCLGNGVPAEKISYSGVWKTDLEVKMALDAGVKRFIPDSLKQLQMIRNLAEKKGETVDVWLRLSSGNQFGMNIREIAQIFAKKQPNSNINMAGIHYYAGTQRQFVYQVEKDFQPLAEGLAYLKERGISFSKIRLGGGMGVPLYQNDSVRTYEETADYLFGFVRKLSEHYRITYECGRAIASNAGRYITKVFEKKQRENREILLVQGGSHHLKYHGNIVGQKTPFIECVAREERQGEQTYMVCGSLCSAGDILAMKFLHSCVEIGDYMIFYHVGAYSLQEAAILFLKMEMPDILVYNGNNSERKLLELGWISREKGNI